MVRLALRLAGASWIVVGAAAGLVGTVGREPLRAALPPLVIDADALSGAVLAIAFVAALVGVVHVALSVVIGDGSGWGSAATTLLAAIACVSFIGLALAAVSSAAREAALAPMLAGAAVVAALVAMGYGWLAVTVIRGRRTGPPT